MSASSIRTAVRDLLRGSLRDSHEHAADFSGFRLVLRNVHVADVGRWRSGEVVTFLEIGDQSRTGWPPAE
ncbi:hypothetical protein FraQA3DRAFT_4445 [Frankia sp. QA3]|nr:hypothetical protein FraQA3DRAFT_4445 [Frankia sp. QA3]